MFRHSRRELMQAGLGALIPAALARGATGEGDGASLVVKSQVKPEPTIRLPTDALPAPQGPKKRIAAITTHYSKYSHADDIITKFIEGYSIAERVHLPHCDVVSLHVEQTPESDIGRGMAARYNIPWAATVEEALTKPKGGAPIDGVLLIGEHGDYPHNEKGQQLYPRRRIFGQIVDVFRETGRAVPVYNDKHYSYSWPDATWMYRQSRELNFAMMAGSSVPVAWRRPALAFKNGVPLKGAVSIGFAGLEAYGFHTLELLQSFVERRRGGETGIASVQCLRGEATWNAARKGEWRADLLAAGLKVLPDASKKAGDIDALQKADPTAAVFLVEYADGFKAAAFVAGRMTAEFGFAAEVEGLAGPVATWCELNKPQRDHFSFLCNHIEVMFRTGKPSYPVERTYVVTGALAALMDSNADEGRKIATPHLRSIRYVPAPEITEA